jgi:serine/threonine protein kinase
MTTQVQLPGPQAVSSLRTSIDKALTTRQFDNRISQYLQPSDIDNLASNLNVRNIVESDETIPRVKKDLLVNDIGRNGRRMFVICLAANITMDYLSIFLLHGATDAEIPFAHDKFNDQPQDVRENASVFNEFQYLVPQVLTGGDFAAHYSSAGVPIELPGSSQGVEPLGFGVSGAVYKARIDTDYCKIPEITAESDQVGLTREVAIKVYKLGNKVQEIHARREISFADTLATDRPHKHVMKSYAAFTVHTQGQSEDSRYLVSELAQNSLQGLMLNESISSEKMTQGEGWVQQQIRGLAGALKLIHEPQDSRTGVHHDIKPDNILACGKGVTLKFTDWGCASFRASDDTPLSSPKTSARGQFPYLPPEHLDILPAGSPTGRPHDIWALGCVFTEILVWLTEGKDGHGTFAKDVYEKEGEHNCWFVGQDSTLDLSKVLKDKLDLLELGKWRNLVSIIRKMFTIDPQKRITARDLVIALDDPRNQI